MDKNLKTILNYIYIIKNDKEVNDFIKNIIPKGFGYDIAISDLNDKVGCYCAITKKDIDDNNDKFTKCFCFFIWFKNEGSIDFKTFLNRVMNFYDNIKFMYLYDYDRTIG